MGLVVVERPNGQAHDFRQRTSAEGRHLRAQAMFPTRAVMVLAAL